MSPKAGDAQPDAVVGADSAPAAGEAAGEATVVETDTVTEPGEGEVAADASAEAGGATEASEAAAGEARAAGEVVGADAAATELIDLGEPVELAEPVTVAAGGHRWQRVLIVVSFVIVALAVVGGAIAIISSLTHGFKKPVTITYKKSAIFSLKTGDCLDPVGSQSYTLVACDQPHQAEVFGTFELPSGKWPGTAATRAAASSGCASRLTGYLNPQLAISLATTYVFPDSVAWQAGTRTVICEVQATSGQLSQSVKGA